MTTDQPVTSAPPVRVTSRATAAEAPPTLAEPVPQALSFADQLGLWGNLGVSLLGFTGALFVLQPGGAGTPSCRCCAACIALVLGHGARDRSAWPCPRLPGARTGAPAMVLLRGLFGARLSYLPTALNIVQCSAGASSSWSRSRPRAHIAPRLPRWVYVLIAGVITALLTVCPLGAIRVLRRYAAVVVAAVLVYLLVQLPRHPLPPLAHGSWSGFWPATDTVVAVAISFAPMAADYIAALPVGAVGLRRRH